MKNPVKQIRRTDAQIRTLLNNFSNRNDSVIKFCKKHKIHKATFYNWRNKYGIQVEKPAEFIPVQVAEPSLTQGLFAEIELASNVTIRLYQRVDAFYFKTLLKV